MTEKEIRRLISAVRKNRGKRFQNYEESYEKSLNSRETAMTVNDRIVKYGAIMATRM